MLPSTLVLTILNLELGSTSYNGIEGGETKQRDGAHHHGDKLCSILTFDGDGTLVCCNKGGEKRSLSKMAMGFACNKQSNNQKIVAIAFGREGIQAIHH
jgi:hypothetical protein